MKDEFSKFAEAIYKKKYAHVLKTDSERKESWAMISRRVPKFVFGAVDTPKHIEDRMAELIRNRKSIPGGRYLYSTGRPYHQTQNCMLFRVADSREGWGDLMNRSCLSLMSGAGIGCVYSEVREYGKPVRRTGGYSTGPLSPMQMVNDAGRHFKQGGDRNAAIWAGLHWWHGNIHKFIKIKDWLPEVRELKSRNFNFHAPMDNTNISVILDDGFFKAYYDEKDPRHSQAHSVFWETTRSMLRTSEPGFSVNTGKDNDECLRNACCEITSCDDNDVCNLASINMARINSLDEMREAVHVTTAFLLAGTVYSEVPFPAIDQIRTKNRRLGLGLMGLHDWLLRRGKIYGPDSELEKYLEIYRDQSRSSADYWADKWGLSRPKKVCAVAPTGSIGIVAETTTGIEPVFCVAFKRRYVDGKSWHYQYVVENVANKLIQDGIDPDSIEDSFTLASDVERRLSFQAWVQKYVDHAISSTINLPAWGSELNNEDTVQEFGRKFLKYLPELRGLTCYTDGSRPGQPLTPIKYSTAIKHLGQDFVEQSIDVCEITGKGGTCGG